MYKHLANLTTITGLIIVSYSFIKYYLTRNIIYLVFACIGFLFDFLDGWLARKFNIKSKIGNILDKIVDKLHVMDTEQLAKILIEARKTRLLD